MNGHGNAQLEVLALEILGDGLFRHAVAVVEQVERKLPAILGAHLVAAKDPAGFVKDLRRSLGAVLIRLQADIAVGDRGGVKRIRGLLQTVEDAIRDGLTVGSVLQRLTNRRVAQDLTGGVHNDMAGRGGVRQTDRELVAVQILADGIGVDHVLAEDQVDLAGFQSHDTGLVIGNDLDRDLADGRSLAPVVLVPLKHRVFIGHEIRQHIGAGANVAIDAILRAAVDHAAGGDHGKGTDAAQLRQHGVVRLAHLNDEGIFIGSRHAHQQVHHFQPSVAFAVFQNGVEVGKDGIGIALFAIREQNIGTNVEGVGAAILADVPAFRQTALIAICRNADQCIVEDALGIHFACIQMRVQITNITIVDKDQLIADFPGCRSGSGCSAGRSSRRRTGAAGSQHAGAAGTRHQQTEVSARDFHSVFPPVVSKNISYNEKGAPRLPRGAPIGYHSLSCLTSDEIGMAFHNKSL